MTLPFTPRDAKVTVEGEARKVTALVVMDLTLAKGERRRRYAIAPTSTIGHHRGEVWIDDRLHRRLDVAGKMDAVTLRREFDRELADLQADGWIPA